jgi:hypothetical protein
MATHREVTLRLLRFAIILLAAMPPPCSPFPTIASATRELEAEMTKEKLLAALDKPRSVYSLKMVVNPSGSVDEVQIILMKMRDQGLVKFDINRGLWSRA